MFLDLQGVILFVSAVLISHFCYSVHLPGTTPCARYAASMTYAEYLLIQDVTSIYDIQFENRCMYTTLVLSPHLLPYTHKMSVCYYHVAS